MPTQDAYVVADANINKEKEHLFKSIQVSDAFAEVLCEIKSRSF